MTLKAQLRALEHSFDPGELGFLALTSKVEGVFRDRLAFRLARALLPHPDISASREWQRVDVAVLRDKQPALLLEITAMYSFDLRSPKASTQYPGKLQRDVRKMRKHLSSTGDNDPHLFTLLLVTHPERDWDRSWDSILKYGRGNRNGRPETLTATRALVKEHFADHPVASKGLLSSDWFEHPVSVLYWLFGPYPSAA